MDLFQDSLSDFLPTGLNLTQEFFEKLLNRQIVGFKITPDSNFLENLSSVVIGIEIQLSLWEVPIYLIIKSLPTEKDRCKLVQKYHFFPKEFFVYNHWIPEIKSLIKILCPGIEENIFQKLTPSTPQFIGGRVIGDPFNAQPNCDASYFNETFLSMKDMTKSHGFKMATNLLDVHHCRLVISELAKVHALSWAYKQHHGLSHLSDKYPLMRDYLHAEAVEDNLTAQIQPIIAWSIKAVEVEFGVDSLICQKAKQLIRHDHFQLLKLFLDRDGIKEEKVDRILQMQCSQKNTTVNWLLGCHGDARKSNILFKYDEKSVPKEVMLLDFQLFQEACPTTDIAYLLFTSTDAEFRKEYCEDILHHYHLNFLETSRELGTEPLPGFNFETLKSRYNRAKFYGFTLFLILFSLHAPNPSSLEFESQENDLIAIADWRSRLFGIILELC